MIHIRKHLAGLAVLGLALAVSATSHAAFTSKGINPPISASAAVGGTPTVEITSVVIKSTTTNASVGTIDWGSATPGAGWLAANAYIELKTNINTTNGGVQMYTDNTHAT